jgi:polyisoprenoid-binding protein YceI
MAMRSLVVSSMIVLLTLTVCAPARSKALPSKKDSCVITYRLVHPLHEIESTSHEGIFTLEADAATKSIQSASAVVDVMTFDSGNSNRDSHAMEVIDAISYPDVRFTTTSILASGDSLSITGKLTFHGITHDITARALQLWSAQSLEVKGAFNVSLTDFSVDRPSLLMIPVEDKLSFTFTAVFAL